MISFALPNDLFRWDIARKGGAQCRDQVDSAKKRSISRVCTRDCLTNRRRSISMKYFIDTHDKNKGSFPAQELTEQQFFEQFAALEEAAKDLGVFGHAAHVNLKEGKAFCFMSGPDEESIRKAHAAINLPYDSITEVRRVTGADMRIPKPVNAQMRKAG